MRQLFAPLLALLIALGVGLPTASALPRGPAPETIAPAATVPGLTEVYHRGYRHRSYRKYRKYRTVRRRVCRVVGYRWSYGYRRKITRCFYVPRRIYY